MSRLWIEDDMNYSLVMNPLKQMQHHPLRWSSIRFRIVTMKLHHQLNQLNHSQKSAFVAVFVILFPLFIPNLFQPLGRASPSIFSVTPHFPFPQLIVKIWIWFTNDLIFGIKIDCNFRNGLLLNLDTSHCYRVLYNAELWVHYTFSAHSWV